jgi:hypothetical protein
MARKPFPLETLFAASDSLMRAATKLTKKSGREAVAALLLSAATVAVKAGYDKKEFRRGVELAWRLAAGGS